MAYDKIYIGIGIAIAIGIDSGGALTGIRTDSPSTAQGAINPHLSVGRVSSRRVWLRSKSMKPDFPWSWQPAVYRCKRIRGKLHDFGPRWGDWQVALAKYQPRPLGKPLVADVTYGLYASIRVEKTGDQGQAFMSRRVFRTADGCVLCLVCLGVSAFVLVTLTSFACAAQTADVSWLATSRRLLPTRLTNNSASSLRCWWMSGPADHHARRMAAPATDPRGVAEVSRPDARASAAGETGGPQDGIVWHDNTAARAV